MSVIAQFTPKDPEPLTQSGSSFVSDNGEIQVQFTKDDQGNNVVQFTDLARNTSVSWLPQEIKYIDDNGLEDIIVAADQSSDLFVMRNYHARYDRHFPDVEEYWRVEAGQIKHHMTVTGDQRAPLSFLVNPKLAIGGILEFDCTYQVSTNGLIMSGDFDTGSSIDIVDANRQTVFTLPAVEVWDQAQNRTTGTYHVEQLGPGRIYVATCVSNAWVEGDDIVYPVVIDPTVIVSASYSLGTNGGRKIVKLSNGWIIAGVYNSSAAEIYLYVSKDNGNTFSFFAATYFPSTDWAIACSGTIVYLLSVASTNTEAYFYSFDALTFNSSSPLQPTSQPDSGQTGFGPGCSLAVDGNGSLWAQWCSKNSTYPNSYNIRVSSSTNGGSTWSTPTQLTTMNQSGYNATNPCIVVNSSNIPICFWQVVSDGYAIECKYYTGTSWSSVITIFSAQSVAQYNPIGIVDSSGNIHAFWHQNTANAFIIYHSVSTNGGSTWSTQETVYGNAQNTFYALSVGYDPNKNQFYVFFTDSSSAVRYVFGNTNSWSAAITITTAGVSVNQGVQVLWSEFNENSSDAIRYMFNFGTQSIEYGSITLNSPPNAPILSPASNFDATTSETLSWQFSDSNSGDTQSAYELQIYDVAAGATVVDTGKVASTTSSYTLEANTLANGKQYQWRVMTWDEQGAQGPYSQYGTFNTAAAPTAVLTYPTANMTDATSSITAQWSYSDPANNAQASYDLQLLDANGDVLWDSGVVNDSNGTIRQMTVGYTLENNTSYQLRITATNSQGISSSPVTVAFSTSFTPPPQPTTTATPDNAHARMVIDIVNPAPSGTQPAVSYNDIFRRNHGDSSWQRIATQVPTNGTYYDYATASGQAYDYKVTSYGSNGTQIDSTVISKVSIDLSNTGTWIHDVSDPAGTLLNLPYFNNSMGSTDGTIPNGEQYTPNAETIQFAGRALPVVEFGENYEYTITKGSIVCLDEDGTWPVLENLIRNLQTTLCLRDGRGKMIFGNIPSGYSTKQLIFGTQVDIAFQQTAYSLTV